MTTGNVDAFTSDLRARGLICIIVPIDVSDACCTYASEKRLQVVSVTPQFGAKTSRELYGPPWFCAFVHGVMKMRQIFYQGSFEPRLYDLTVLDALVHFARFVDTAAVDAIWRLGGDDAAFKAIDECLTENEDVQDFLRRFKGSRNA